MYEVANSELLIEKSWDMTTDTDCVRWLQLPTQRLQLVGIVLLPYVLCTMILPQLLLKLHDCRQRYCCPISQWVYSGRLAPVRELGDDDRGSRLEPF